jgi:CheY-like chemotaxis protein
MGSMRIVLVEDNYLWVDLMKKSLNQAFKSSQVEVDVVKTELGFRERFEEFQRHPPDLFIIDVMLRWTTASSGMTMPPAEVTGGSATPPGFRCQELLAASPATRDVPVLLNSAFHSSNWESKLRALPPHAVYLPKADLEPILEKIRQFTGQS